MSRADAFYKQGVRLYSDKKWADAKAAFVSAFALNPTFDVAFNLGSAEFQLGEHREAAEHLAFALRSWPLTSAVSGLRSIAQQRLDESKTFVATITVKVNVAHAEVVVDGKSAGQSPLKGEVFLAPGAHTIVALLDGYDGAKTTMQAEKGSTKTITLELAAPAPIPAVVATADAAPTVKPSASSAPVVPPVIVPPAARSVIPGVLVAGVGLAALALGTGLFVAGNGKRSTAEELQKGIADGHRSCVSGAPNFDMHCTDLANAASSADTLHGAGFGLLIGGGAAVAGAITYLLWPSSKPTTGASVRVLPVATTTGGGLFAAGNF
ncbi:MAG: PEGA domain-containing protein [Byssovorax sp.]